MPKISEAGRETPLPYNPTMERVLQDAYSRGIGVFTTCGNHGWIDTRGTRTPAGKDVGRVNYCICPNGQQLRAIGAKLPSNTEEHNAEV